MSGFFYARYSLVGENPAWEYAKAVSRITPIRKSYLDSPALVASGTWISFPDLVSKIYP